MRKIILLEHVTLDGYVAGPEGEMDWVRLPDEIWDYSNAFTGQCDAAIYGRNTYGMMASYWPTAAEGANATQHDRDHAAWVNGAQRYVFSNTLDSAPWGDKADCSILRGDLATEVGKLKAQAGGNIFLVGSVELAQGLTRAGLVNEYHLMLNPVLLGGGKSLFPDGLPQALNLQLVSQRALSLGVLALHYEPA